MIVASEDHLARGISEGVCQASHGKKLPLTRMKLGDWIVFYSPKEKFGSEIKSQKFTAIARVKDDIIFQVHMTPDFAPYRRRVEYFDCKPAPILPLISSLSFIKDKRKWGFPFRRGSFEINRKDFLKIASAIGVEDLFPNESAHPR